MAVGLPFLLLRWAWCKQDAEANAGAQVTYLNNVVMPDEASSGSDDDEGSGESEGEGEGSL